MQKIINIFFFIPILLLLTINLFINRQVEAYTSGQDCPWSACGLGPEGCGDAIVVPASAGSASCVVDYCKWYQSCWDSQFYRPEPVRGCCFQCVVGCPAGYNPPTIPAPENADTATVVCSACSNSSITCWKPGPTATTAPPPGGPTNTPAPTATPVPTSTPTLIPTSTPRPSSTPTPTPNKQFNPVTVPTTAPRQSGAVGSALSMTWKCLKAEKTANSSYGETRLTGDGFPVNTNIDIVSCVQGNTFYCTTGNPSRDTALNIKALSGHVFKLANKTNPIQSTTGTVDVLVESKTQAVTTHVFYGVYAGDFNDYPGEASSIQYATFDFEQDYKKCVAIRWDPYGRVFDSQSLEPMPGINIFISDKNRKIINLPGIINPVTTNPAGFFNFYVEPGEYYLEPESVEGYTFSANPNLNTNHNKIYSNLYKPSEPIYEIAGSAQHRDIALDPGFNQPLKNSPKEISFNILPGQDTTQTKIIGEVSHPLTRVEIFQEKNKLGETIADKFGYYEILIDNEKIKQEVPIIPKLTKIDLYSSGAANTNKNLLNRIINYLAGFFKPRSTKADPPKSVTGSSLMPILHYLEGFVYNKNKQIAANVMVEVVITMSDQVYYQTQTNDAGLLVVMPDSLPIFEYYLKVTPNNGSSFTMTTEEFIQLNKDYLNTNQINLINATKNNLPVVQ